MRCNTCKKGIKGQYRSWFSYKLDGYINDHKACCIDDPMWNKLENNELKLKEYHKSLLDACQEFKEKWNVDELDDLIESLEEM